MNNQFTPLTEDQYNKAVSAGFSPDQIIANEQIRKQQAQTSSTGAGGGNLGVMNNLQQAGTNIMNGLTQPSQELNQDPNYKGIGSGLIHPIDTLQQNFTPAFDSLKDIGTQFQNQVNDVRQNGYFNALGQAPARSLNAVGDLIGAGYGALGGAINTVSDATLGKNIGAYTVKPVLNTIGGVLGGIASTGVAGVEGLGQAAFDMNDQQANKYLPDPQKVGSIALALAPEIGSKAKDTTSPVVDRITSMVSPDQAQLVQTAKNTLDDTLGQWKNSTKAVAGAASKGHDVADTIIAQGVLPTPVDYGDGTYRWDTSKATQAQFYNIENTANKLDEALQNLPSNNSLAELKNNIIQDIQNNRFVKREGNTQEFINDVNNKFNSYLADYGENPTNIEINDIKKGLYKSSNTWNSSRNIFKPSPADLNAYDIAALTLKKRIEDIGLKNDVPEVNYLNDEMSKSYDAIKALKSIDGNVVKGGKLTHLVFVNTARVVGGLIGHAVTGGLDGALFGGVIGDQAGKVAERFVKTNTGLGSNKIIDAVKKNAEPVSNGDVNVKFSPPVGTKIPIGREIPKSVDVNHLEKNQISQTVSKTKSINKNNIDTSIPQTAEKARLITKESYDQTLKAFKKDLGNMNSGIDPVQVARAVKLATYHVQEGIITAIELSKKLADEGIKLSKKVFDDVYSKAVQNAKLNDDQFIKLQEFKDNSTEANMLKARAVAQDLGLSDKFILNKEKFMDWTNNVVSNQVARQDLVARTKTPTIPKELKPLVEEAKKYKSAEEFAKAQGTPVYHGTNAKFEMFNDTNMKNGWLGKGIYFTPEKTFAKENGKFIKEVILETKNPFVIKGDSPNDVLSEIKAKFPQADEFNMAKILKDNGYDSIKFKHWDKGEMTTVFSKDQIKSKQQLTDLWQKANKK